MLSKTKNLSNQEGSLEVISKYLFVTKEKEWKIEALYNIIGVNFFLEKD